jgi:hypothetical protein
MWIKTLGTTTVLLGLACGGTAFAASNPTGKGAFCWQKAGDTMDCKYATMAACAKAAGSDSECVPNPNRSTTGMKSGGGMKQK